MSDLIPVPFRDATRFLADIDGTPYTPMRPIVEGMGLSWAAQTVKFNSDKARWVVAIIETPSAGGPQEALCLPVRKLTGWLMTIQPSRVKPEIREKVIAYQNECDNALWDYWTHGRAANPRQPAGAPLDPANLSRLQLIQIAMQAEDADDEVSLAGQIAGFYTPLLPRLRTAAKTQGCWLDGHTEAELVGRANAGLAGVERRAA